MAVLMVEGLTRVWIVVFKPPCKCLGQTIHSTRVYHRIMRGLEMVPLQQAGILAIFIKLPF